MAAEKRLAKWTRSGACRYGKEGPTAAGAAILDQAWTPTGEAVLGPVLGSQIGEFKSLQGPDNGENSQGSSYGSGWYGYVYKGLRQVLGDTVCLPLSPVYIGGCSLATPRQTLWGLPQVRMETHPGPQHLHN